MTLIERYVFRKTAQAFLLSITALAVMVWLTMALREFDLVTGRGQSVWTFISVSVLLLPALLSIVCPVALLIAVVYTFTALNSDSELAVINASGTRPWSLLKPILALGVLTTLLVATLTLYFSPLALRTWQELTTRARADIITTIMQEGAFMSLADGLVFHLRERQSDGTFSGVFLSDDRQADMTTTYLARRAAILENPLGVFLVMGDGTIQRRDKRDHSISIIEFSSYAFDLSTFASSSAVPALTPAERPTSYLLDPDPADRYFQQFPQKFRVELHERLATPLYVLVFAILPLVFLAQAESTRENRTASITGVIVAVVVVRAVGVVLPSLAETRSSAMVAMYAVPLGVTVAAIVMVLMGIQLRPPKRAVAMSEYLYGRAGGLLRTPGVQAES
jgi:lipopolysaccharide export system permease protein